MNEIKELLEKKVIFHCTPRGGTDGNSNFEVIHSTSSPKSNVSTLMKNLTLIGGIQNQHLPTLGRAEPTVIAVEFLCS
jgi:hypothetical protein